MSCPGCGAARNEVERCTADPGPPQIETVPGLQRITSCCAAPGTRSISSEFVARIERSEIQDSRMSLRSMRATGDADKYRYPFGRAIGASAKIWYCCARGFAASAGSTNCSELLPKNARGRIITRMKRLARSAACAKTGSGPASYQAPPGPWEGEPRAG